MQERKQDDSRRDFVKKLAYAVPVVVSLKAAPAFARTGSRNGGGGGGGGGGEE
jgi:hypothetical protein